MDRQQDLATATAHAVLIKAAVRHRPELAGAVNQLINDAGLSEYVDGVLAEDHTQWTWDEAAWRAQSEEELTGAPFSDAAPIRLIEFGALGQHWRVRCNNVRLANIAAEEFCAAVQVILVELAMADPVLLETTIEIDVELFDATNQPSERVQPVPDNTCARWRVYLPTEEPASAHDADTQTLTMLIQILHGSSLLPADKFMAVMEGAFRSGLSHKLTVINSYRHIAAAFAIEPDPADGVHAMPLGAPRQFPLRTVPELAAPTTAGPGYTSEEAERAIRARYEHSAAATRHTLPRALADKTLRAMFSRLLHEGRKEWHLLMALANLTLNHRINNRHGPLAGPPDRLRRVVEREELTREERAEDPSPSVAEITESFDVFLAIAAASSLRRGACRSTKRLRTFEAIEALLRKRYRYWEDDVRTHPFLLSPGGRAMIILFRYMREALRSLVAQDCAPLYLGIELIFHVQDLFLGFHHDNLGSCQRVKIEIIDGLASQHLKIPRCSSAGVRVAFDLCIPEADPGIVCDLA